MIQERVASARSTKWGGPHEVRPPQRARRPRPRDRDESRRPGRATVTWPDRGAAAGPAPSTVWRVDGEGHGRPASDAATAYFLSTRHEVVAIAAATGAVRWRQSTSEPGASTAGSAVVLAGSVVVAGDYNLVAFDRVTGAFRWRFVPSIGYAPGIYLGESSGGLVLAGSPAGRVYAVSAATGEVEWTAVIATDGRTTVFQPATDGTVVAAGYTTFTAPNVGGVVLVELGTGRELWRAAFPRPADPLLGTGSTGGPVLTDTAVIASSGDGTVYGFNRTNGSILWTLPPIRMVPPILQGPVPLRTTSAGADYRPLARTGQHAGCWFLEGTRYRVRPCHQTATVEVRGRLERVGVVRARQRQPGRSTFPSFPAVMSR